MPRVLALLALAAAPALADTPVPATVDCYCTDSGGSRVELGESICLRVDGRAFTALCEMAGNVPIWRDTGIGCLSSRASEPPPHGVEPGLDPSAVDAQIAGPET